MNNFDVVMIGTSHNGLVTGCYLANAVYNSANVMLRKHKSMKLFK